VIALFTDEVTFAVRAAVDAGSAGPVADDAYVQVPSKAGKYASHRFRVMCQTADEVLDLFVRVRSVQGVITLM
jgi:hypothetical protein